MKDYRILHDERLRVSDWGRRIVRYWPEFISLSASIVTIFSLFVVLFNFTERATLALIYTIELSLFSLFLIVYVISQEYRFSRKARYAEATYSIHSCVHFLRDLHFDLENIQKKVDCKQALSKVVTSFANAFSLVTGTHCRACIKTIEIRNISPEKFYTIIDKKEQVNYLFVNTFCRDTITANNHRDEYIHPVISNTDFLELYLDIDKRFFFCNNIDVYKGTYQNSSAQSGKKLSYRSTIVWPIRRLVYGQDGGEKAILNQEQDIIGFLCVDSGRRNVFRSNYDIELGAIVADSLFVFLKSYHNFIENKQASDNNIKKGEVENARKKGKGQ